MLSTSQFSYRKRSYPAFLGRRFRFGNRRIFAGSFPSRFRLDLAGRFRFGNRRIFAGRFPSRFRLDLTGKWPENSGEFPSGILFPFSAQFPAISPECSGKCIGSGRFRPYIFDLGFYTLVKPIMTKIQQNPSRFDICWLVFSSSKLIKELCWNLISSIGFLWPYPSHVKKTR